MTQFTKSFIWRFIVYSLGFGLIAFIVCRLISVWVSRSFGADNMVPLYITAILSSLVYSFLMIFVANKTIGVISKKGCYSYPEDERKWFRNFAVIIIGLNILSSLYSFMQWRSNVASYAKKMSDLELKYSTELVAGYTEVVSKYNINLIIMLILQNVIGIAIILFFTPKLIQKYRNS